MPHNAPHESWRLSREGGTSIIVGPGGLLIDLGPLNPTRLRRPQASEIPDLTGDLVWRYPLDNEVDWLELHTQIEEESPDAPPRHCLYAGPQISWLIPAEFAEALTVWLEGKDA